MSALAHETFERSDRLVQLPFSTMEIADSPGRHGKGPPLIDHLRNTDTFVRACNPLIEFPKFRKAEHQPHAGENRRWSGQPEAFAQQIALEGDHVPLENG